MICKNSNAIQFHSCSKLDLVVQPRLPSLQSLVSFPPTSDHACGSRTKSTIWHGTKRWCCWEGSVFPRSASQRSKNLQPHASYLPRRSAHMGTFRSGLGDCFNSSSNAAICKSAATRSLKCIEAAIENVRITKKTNVQNLTSERLFQPCKSRILL